MENTENTCQVCGRPIKAKSGLIAHHGYKRPQYGWQTASCIGARHLPYEESCDVLPVAIDKITNYIELESTALKNFIANPPDELTIFRGSYDRTGTVRTRPENFDPKNMWTAGYRTYESAFKSQTYRMEQNVKYAKLNLEYMQERLTKWTKIR